MERHEAQCQETRALAVSHRRRQGPALAPDGKGNGSHEIGVCGAASVDDVPLLPGLVNLTSHSKYYITVISRQLILCFLSQSLS